jgi:hypothetical protein
MRPDKSPWSRGILFEGLLPPVLPPVELPVTPPSSLLPAFPSPLSPIAPLPTPAEAESTRSTTAASLPQRRGARQRPSHRSPANQSVELTAGIPAGECPTAAGSAGEAAAAEGIASPWQLKCGIRSLSVNVIGGGIADTCLKMEWNGIAVACGTAASGARSLEAEWQYIAVHILRPQPSFPEVLCAPQTQSSAAFGSAAELGPTSPWVGPASQRSTSNSPKTPLGGDGGGGGGGLLAATSSPPHLSVEYPGMLNAGAESGTRRNLSSGLGIASGFGALGSMHSMTSYGSATGASLAGGGGGGGGSGEHFYDAMGGRPEWFVWRFGSSSAAPSRYLSVLDTDFEDALSESLDGAWRSVGSCMPAGFVW